MSVKAELEVTGFTSPENAHAHLLKHVLGLTEQRPEASLAKVDPERWEKRIDEPPLIANFSQRRTRALAQLREVAGCAAGELTRASSADTCGACQSHPAVRVVTDEMKSLLDAYTDVARETIAGRHDSPQLALAYRSDQGPLLDVTDSRKVRVITALDGTLSEARIVTCYRTSDTLKQRAIHYGRERASWSRRGRLLEGE